MQCRRPARQDPTAEGGAAPHGHTPFNVHRHAGSRQRNACRPKRRVPERDLAARTGPYSNSCILSAPACFSAPGCQRARNVATLQFFKLSLPFVWGSCMCVYAASIAAPGSRLLRRGPSQSRYRPPALRAGSLSPDPLLPCCTCFAPAAHSTSYITTPCTPKTATPCHAAVCQALLAHAVNPPLAAYNQAAAARPQTAARPAAAAIISGLALGLPDAPLLWASTTALLLNRVAAGGVLTGQGVNQGAGG